MIMERLFKILNENYIISEKISKESSETHIKFHLMNHVFIIGFVRSMKNTLIDLYRLKKHSQDFQQRIILTARSNKR